MAKKAPGKKKTVHRFDAKRKGGKPKAAASTRKKAATSTRGNTAGKRGPRSQTLPGMEQVRHQVLDNAHEQIAEGRALLAQGHELEKEGIGIALQYMQTHKVRAYRHAGVESVFVEGVSKLRVRVTKDADNAAGSDTHAHHAPEADDTVPPPHEEEFGDEDDTPLSSDEDGD